MGKPDVLKTADEALGRAPDRTGSRVNGRFPLMRQRAQ
ncbi:hypothetical protein OKW43_001221 [Paraburkholderia sp. WC7.3g]